MEFSLAGEEFIELNKLLKTTQLTVTGGESNIRIVNGDVKVNGQIELQKRKKIRAGDVVIYNKTKITVV